VPDFYVNQDGGPGGSKDKAEVNRKIKAPREGLARGLDLLMQVGIQGRSDGAGALVVETGWFDGLLKQNRTVRKFLAGMQTVGLALAQIESETVIRSTRFPVMMAALHALAKACADHYDPNQRVSYFARCDFGALEPGYTVDPGELYRVFNAEDMEKLRILHRYFLDRGYRAQVFLSETHAWEVKYQGSRKVKSTPLFQVEWQDREKRPLRVQVKCASTNRIVGQVPKQSAALQDDFRSKRVNLCRGSECDWCKNHPSLGPAVLEYRGEQIPICWYTNPDVKELTDQAVELVKEYAVMHEALV
jgi:hypothetical protein